MKKKLSIFFLILTCCLFNCGYSSKSNCSVKTGEFLPKYREVFVNVDDDQIFCRIMGSGDPIIVIHGGPGLSQDYLLPQMAILAKSNLLVFYDQRGCGFSLGKVDDKTITIKNFLEDLESIRKALGFKKITVLGHSWGGFLAMKYAIAYPESLDKLILLSTAPATNEDYGLCVKEFEKRNTPIQKQLDEIQKSENFAQGDPETLNSYYKLLFRSYLYDSNKINLLNFIMSQEANIRGGKVNKLLEQNVLEKPYNLFPEQKRLDVPTLIIHGESDFILPITAKKIHENISNSQFILLKNCAHFPYAEEPDDLFNYLEKFLHPEK